MWIQVLGVRVSCTRSGLDAELLLKQALQHCENNPIILVDLNSGMWMHRRGWDWIMSR
ncbi:MAG: hypothetical protein QW158_08250 [Nitrososphaerales archaeon]